MVQDLLQATLETVTVGALGLTTYHHVGYPLLLRRFSRPTQTPPAQAEALLPDITIVMPAHDEAAHIAAKLRNLADLNYPADRLHVLLACDGCSDGTAALAQATLVEKSCRHLNVTILDHAENRGKVAVLNEAIATVRSEIVVLSDISAMLPTDALRRAAAHFADARLGAVGGTYRVVNPHSPGESRYWAMQLGVKRGEAALGAPLGLHGAFYAFRRVAWARLPADTINDDFIQPMQILQRGWRVAYDEEIVVLEAERGDAATDLRRRRRIAAGNAQQLVRLLPMLHPRHRGVAFAFASGKAMRVLMPVLMAVGLVGSLGLAGQSSLFAALAALQVGGLLCAAFGMLLKDSAPVPLAIAAYLVRGHAASLAGICRYAVGAHRRPWQRASFVTETSLMHMPRSVAAAKRAIDIAVASLALVLTAPVWPLIALAIKLDSPGPVLFRQLRVGRAMPDRTELFRMIKFRSMRADAEARSGAVWATKRDPRITRVGLFLRLTRLDEIPQLINVLRGDMSIVGPRPERPGFYGKLEQAIPFFADRTVGLRPGITGLAQVNQGYDTSIDDVRRKVTFDHAYAMRLADFRSWLTSDVGIMAKTVTVMATGRGQ